uniref:Uncharacterized protein n=1 Tax=Aureoumbra lagunensis TaxID=44058 RepID=A0A7S3NP58_9STRA|mmetsp:Transcript_5043/g.7113  ORF Transcript_5043/g.7113 Transcript_5043/m.7113 type:complete len:383 (-) Transcript_5043:418-1566(-)
MPTTYLTVYWEGTANTLSPPTTQIGLFWAATKGVDITDDNVPLPHRASTQQHLKMAFDGCAVTNGSLGLLFAFGLRQQAARVASRIKQILARDNKEEDESPSIVCNVVGLSRGGIAAIFLAQALHMNEEDLELNLLLFDPVPGDQTWSGFPYTGIFAKDITDCACLRRVLALYPHEPLPDITFHAPILVAYPMHCEVEEDVILGCHQGALFATRRSNHIIHQASNLSFRRIVDFLEKVGTKLALEPYFSYQPSKFDILNICRNALESLEPTTRKLHDGLQRGRVIVRRSSGKFLNKYHEHLENQLSSDSNTSFLSSRDETKSTTRDASYPSSAQQQNYQAPSQNNKHFASYTPQYMLDIIIPDEQRSCFLLPTSSASFSSDE